MLESALRDAANPDEPPKTTSQIARDSELRDLLRATGHQLPEGQEMCIRVHFRRQMDTLLDRAHPESPQLCATRMESKTMRILPQKVCTSFASDEDYCVKILVRLDEIEGGLQSKC